MDLSLQLKFVVLITIPLLGFCQNLSECKYAKVQKSQCLKQKLESAINGKFLITEPKQLHDYIIQCTSRCEFGPKDQSRYAENHRNQTTDADRAEFQKKELLFKKKMKECLEETIGYDPKTREDECLQREGIFSEEEESKSDGDFLHQGSFLLEMAAGQFRNVLFQCNPGERDATFECIRGKIGFDISRVPAPAKIYRSVCSQAEACDELYPEKACKPVFLSEQVRLMQAHCRCKQRASPIGQKQISHLRQALENCHGVAHLAVERQLKESDEKEQQFGLQRARAVDHRDPNIPEKRKTLFQSAPPPALFVPDTNDNDHFGADSYERHSRPRRQAPHMFLYKRGKRQNEEFRSNQGPGGGFLRQGSGEADFHGRQGHPPAPGRGSGEFEPDHEFQGDFEGQHFHSPDEGHFHGNAGPNGAPPNGRPNAHFGPNNHNQHHNHHQTPFPSPDNAAPIPPNGSGPQRRPPLPPPHFGQSGQGVPLPGVGAKQFDCERIPELFYNDPPPEPPSFCEQPFYSGPFRAFGN